MWTLLWDEEIKPLIQVYVINVVIPVSNKQTKKNTNQMKQKPLYHSILQNWCMFLTSYGKAKHKGIRQGFYDSRGSHGINVEFYYVHGFILLISNYPKSKNASPHSVLIYTCWKGKKCRDKLMCAFWRHRKVWS